MEIHTHKTSFPISTNICDRVSINSMVNFDAKISEKEKARRIDGIKNNSNSTQDVRIIEVGVDLLGARMFLKVTKN